MFERWRDQTPDGFVVAVKVSRYLTHIKRLRDPAEPVARLIARAEGLGDRLGPYLLQLPPTLRAAPDALDACLACFPRGARVAVEPRHGSWWTDEVRDVLTRRRAALCWADRLGRPATPLWRTADWGYVRMHEGTASPRPSYGRSGPRHLARPDRRRVASDVRWRRRVRVLQQRPGRRGPAQRPHPVSHGGASGAGGGAADARLASPGCRPPPTAPASPSCPPACGPFSPMRSRPVGASCPTPMRPSPSCGPRRPPPTRSATCSTTMPVCTGCSCRGRGSSPTPT